MTSLQEELKAYNQKSRSKKTTEQLAVMDGATQALKDLNLAQKALKIGDTAPDFTLPNAQGKSVNLKELLQKKAVLISFYRGAWCPYCNIELRTLQKVLPQIQEANIDLVAISPHTPDNSLTTQEKNELTFEVLSDANNQLARQFGLVHQLPADLRELYLSFAIDLQKSNGEDSFELPLPATYLIDREGKIIYAFVNEDYTQRVNLDELLAKIKTIA